jgi:hypothetical protein
MRDRKFSRRFSVPQITGMAPLPFANRTITSAGEMQRQQPVIFRRLQPRSFCAELFYFFKIARGETALISTSPDFS